MTSLSVFRTIIIAIPDVELNYWLAKFVVEVRKRENGEAYCVNNLYQMLCS